MNNPIARFPRRLAMLLGVILAFALPQFAHASEASLRIPDLNQYTVGGIGGHTLLAWGLAVCVLGLIFGLVIMTRLRNLPVHSSMREVSETIYETCKTYLMTQGKFILLLEVFIATVIIIYFGWLANAGVNEKTNEVLHGFPPIKVAVIVLFSLVGIAGSYSVAWFGIRVNTYANSRTAMASLAGKPYPCYAIPLSAGISIGMVLISVELFIMLCILLFVPKDYAGPCFIGFAIG
jgi:K(+)-stimulated pyrophosphate-energized sodium pump